VRPPVQQVELLQRRGPQPVDQDRHARALGEPEVADERIHEVLGDLVGRLERTAAGAGLAVDADADLHLALGQLEARHARGRQDGRREPDADGRGVLHDVLGDRRDLLQGVAALGRRTGGLVGEDDPGHAPPVQLALVRLARDVVPAQHGRGPDVLQVCHVGREVEVEDVPAVVAVQVQHPRPAVDGLGRLEDLLRAGRAEDVADGDAGAQACPHVPLEQGEVAGAAAGDDADLAGDRRVRPDQHPMSSPGVFSISGWASRMPSTNSSTNFSGALMIFFMAVRPFMWRRRRERPARRSATACAGVFET
jgi:hypothetical protein